MMIRLLIPVHHFDFGFAVNQTKQRRNHTRFFLKMRTRVRGLGPEVDQKDVEEAYANPEKTKEMLLFPNTSLEIYKWNKQDIVGFLISIGVVFVVLGTLFIAVGLGS
jgi:hypothetical protein